MTDDPVLAAVQRFMDAVETRLGTLTGETRSLLTDARSALAELQTRAAPIGLQGERGLSGERGDPGPAGPQGAPGPAGEKGERGADGSAGTNGRDGVDGKAGERGEPGLAGTNGERGAPGERGADGLHGRDGAPGAPGAQGERGADGIATLAELDARIEARFAELQMRTFADVYQGVFETDKVYTRGLLATWGGSLWLSLNDTRSKPGEDGDWRLVVKRGADGRK